MKRASSTCRLRKVQCEECGYTARITRSWLTVGLPGCPCGGELRPTEPADLALCGLIGPEDMPSPLWTAICRENGWEDSIVRRGAAAKAYERTISAAGGFLAREAGQPQCAYAAAGSRTNSAEEFCAEHKPARVVVDACCPF